MLHLGAAGPVADFAVPPKRTSVFFLFFSCKLFCLSDPLKFLDEKELCRSRGIKDPSETLKETCFSLSESFVLIIVL